MQKCLEFVKDGKGDQRSPKEPKPASNENCRGAERGAWRGFGREEMGWEGKTRLKK